jgi:hypothetical protein
MSGRRSYVCFSRPPAFPDTLIIYNLGNTFGCRINAKFEDKSVIAVGARLRILHWLFRQENSLIN